MLFYSVHFLNLLMYNKIDENLCVTAICYLHQCNNNDNSRKLGIGSGPGSGSGLGPGSWVLGPGSWVLDPGPRTQDPLCGLAPGRIGTRNPALGYQDSSMMFNYKL